MRKLAGCTTPCQSKAAATRLMCSPPAAKKLAATRISTSARSAIGSRSDSLGCGQPALSLRAESSARSTWARQSACETGSCSWRRSRSATAVAGRWPSPLTRSSRRRPSCTLGTRNITSGTAAANVTTTNTNRPDRPPERRQGEPEAGPGEGQEQAERGRQQGERRPQAFPQQAAARALERPRQHDPGGQLAFLRLVVQRVQEPLRRPGLGVRLN